MWRVGRPPQTAASSRPPAPAGAPGRPSGLKLPSHQVVFLAAAGVVVVVGLIHRNRKTGSSNGASTNGGTPQTPAVIRGAQGTYDSSGQDVANALSDLSTRVAGLGDVQAALAAVTAASAPGPASAAATAPVVGSGTPSGVSTPRASDGSGPDAPGVQWVNGSPTFPQGKAAAPGWLSAYDDRPVVNWLQDSKGNSIPQYGPSPTGYVPPPGSR